MNRNFKGIYNLNANSMYYNSSSELFLFFFFDFKFTTWQTLASFREAMKSFPGCEL